MKDDQKPFKLKMTQKDSKWKTTKKIQIGDNPKIKMEDDQNNSKWKTTIQFKMEDRFKMEDTKKIKMENKNLN